MKVVEKVMTRNCLRKDSDLISDKMLLLTVIDNWNSLSADCVHCKTINTLRSTSHLHWNRELYSLEVSCYDSRQYTAKAFAYLC